MTTLESGSSAISYGSKTASSVRTVTMERLGTAFLLFPALFAGTYLASAFPRWVFFVVVNILDLERLETFLLDSRVLMAFNAAFALLTSTAICACIWRRSQGAASDGVGTAIAPTVDTKEILLYGSAALVAPFLLEAIWIVAAKSEGPGFPGSGSLVSQAVCACVGAILLARPLRGWVIPAALVYLPLMYAALIGFTLGWDCGIYFDCL
jgi:hypothetical protein